MAPRRPRPARTEEGREQQMMSLAYDEAEKRLRDGTASSQILTHFLRLATTREQLEKERLRLENELTRAKTESIRSQKRIDELYENAMIALGIYNGTARRQEYDEDI